MHYYKRAVNLLQTWFFPILFILLVLGTSFKIAADQTKEGLMQEKKYVTISETIANCKANGHKLPSGAKPIQSDLKKTTSLIGMAYLNYIYQNDLNNAHFCESMLLMNSQIPENTNNPYVHLFDPKQAEKTIAILEDIQLSFDYSIARTDPSIEKLQNSISKIDASLK